MKQNVLESRLTERSSGFGLTTFFLSSSTDFYRLSLRLQPGGGFSQHIRQESFTGIGTLSFKIEVKFQDYLNPA